MTRLRVLTWHVHGSYLRYLAHCDVDLLVPVRLGRPEAYGGRTPGGDWPPNLTEVRDEDVPRTHIDCVLYQHLRNWEVDQFETLSPDQRRLPRLFLEHDPPQEHPTNTRHPVDDPEVQLVHVTPFNALMWDSGPCPVRVIEHGVPDTGYRYRGDIPRGIAVVNDLAGRGRRLGHDILNEMRKEVPIDLVGTGSEAAGGLGEIPPSELPDFISRYRFFFNPIRYTSLGLAVCEAMMAGLPIVGLATTEMVTAVENGVSGYVDTSIPPLARQARRLLDDEALARRLGEGARVRARSRFDLARFCQVWESAFHSAAAGVSGHRPALITAGGHECASR